MTSVVNDFRVRFSRSLLGGLWTILNPLAMVIIYAVVLSQVLKARIDGISGDYAFAIYLTAGLLCWNLFSQIVSGALGLFIANANLIKKAAFPKVVLPTVLLGNNLVDSLALFVAMVLVYVVLGHTLALPMLFAPLLLVLVAGFAVGIGLFVGVLNVFIRDLSQLVPIVLQLGFWFTPIVYPANILPEHIQSLLAFNPLYHFVGLFHDVLVFSRLPDMQSLLIACVLCMTSLTLGLVIFRRASADLSDVL